MTTEPGRNRQLSNALRIVLWCQAREEPFTAAIFARETGLARHTAYRWLQVMEGNGLVELCGDETKLPRYWRAA